MYSTASSSVTGVGGERFVFSSAPRGPGEVQERGRKGRAALVVSSRAGGAHVRQLLLAADVDLEVSGALVDADDLVLVHLVARCGEIWGNAGRFGEMRGDLVLKHLVARRSEERTPLLRILQAVPRRRPLFVREQVAAIAPRECPGRGPGSVQEVSRVPVAAIALVKVARPRLVPREGGSHDRQPARRLLSCNLGSSRVLSGQSLAPAGASPT